MAQSTPLLEEQVVHAVRTLLEVIIEKRDAYPGNSGGGAIRGSHASFAAQAIRDIMSVPELAGAVRRRLSKELEDLAKDVA